MATDRKRSIIQAATKSFALFGYKATTMDGIAKIANVGKGTIYTFFSNKEELFNAILGELIEEMKSIALESIREDESFFENLHRVLYRILDFRRQHELTLKLSQEVKEIGTPAAQEGLAKLENAIISFVKIEIQKGIDKQELKPCDPELTAFVMFKMYIALILDWEKEHNPISKGEIANLFQLYFIHGLAYK